MNHILVCLDGREHTAAVIDWAAWVSQRLDTPLTFLHTLEPQPRMGGWWPHPDDPLLQQIAEVEARRTRLGLEAGGQLLQAARSRALQRGAALAHTVMSEGHLDEVVLQHQPDTRVLVLGTHPSPHGPQTPLGLQPDHHIERVVRAVQRPVLVVPTEGFTRPQRALLAFDGSVTARQAVGRVAVSPLLAGIPMTLLHVGEPEADFDTHLAHALAALKEGHHEVEVVHRPGPPETALPEAVEQAGDCLLVMGAHGHGRIRPMALGSTTGALLRRSQAPVLVLR